MVVGSRREEESKEGCEARSVGPLIGLCQKGMSKVLKEIETRGTRSKDTRARSWVDLLNEKGPSLLSFYHLFFCRSKFKLHTAY